jgi:hypothetical protein
MNIKLFLTHMSVGFIGAIIGVIGTIKVIKSSVVVQASEIVRATEVVHASEVVQATEVVQKETFWGDYGKFSSTCYFPQFLAWSMSPTITMYNTNPHMNIKKVIELEYAQPEFKEWIIKGKQTMSMIANTNDAEEIETFVNKELGTEYHYPAFDSPCIEKGSIIHFLANSNKLTFFPYIKAYIVEVINTPHDGRACVVCYCRYEDCVLSYDIIGEDFILGKKITSDEY